MTKTIGTKVDDAIYEVLRLVCEKDGVNVSDRLRDLVNKFVKEEAPFLVIDPDVCEELKRIAEKKGQDWKQMTCEAILNFCEKCSEEKEAKTETEKEEEDKEAPIQEEKPKDFIEVLKGALQRE